MFRVKVCGISGPQYAADAIRAGATAIGIVLDPASPRYVDDFSFFTQIHTAGVDKVAVFGLYREGLDLDSFDFIQAIGATQIEHGPVWMPVFRPQPFEDLDDWLRATEGYLSVLIDPFDPAQAGGSGTRVDWDKAARFVEKFAGPVVLAGGLTPENVAEAIRHVRPYGVDASSGLEFAPGRKDPRKVEAYCQAARLALVEVHGPIFG